MCNECLKKSRECTYPPSSHRDKSSSGKVLGGVEGTTENRQQSNDSESVLDFDLVDIDDRTQKVIMKFSTQGSSTTTSSIDLFQSDQQMLIDSSRAPVITESLYIPPNPILPSISAIHPSYSYQGIVRSSTHTLSARAIQIPTIPKSIRECYTQFFINFHQGNINEFHYFCFYDYHKFCTTTLLVMTEQPNALRDAVVAFSALIYSTKIDRSVKVLAFLYYTSALQKLRVLLDRIPLSVDECHMALATVLQLASFDVITIFDKTC